MNRKSIIVIIMTFFAGLFAGNKFCKTKYYCAAKKIAKELLTDTAESICPCQLVLVTRYNQEEESTVTDFSQYKSKKRVGLILNKTEPHPDADADADADADEENGADLDDDIIVYPQAVVYKIGETWLWKVL